MTKNRQVELHARLCGIAQILKISEAGGFNSDTDALDAIKVLFPGTVELSEAILDEGPIACERIVNEAKSIIISQIAELVIIFARKPKESDGAWVARLDAQLKTETTETKA